MRKWLTLIKETATNWVSHQDSRQGAALAYYSIFSLGPLIVIAVGIAGLVFGKTAARNAVQVQLQGLLGAAPAKAIEAMLAGASEPKQGIAATGVGAIILLLTAIGVVVQLKDAFNIAWEVDPKEVTGIRQFIRSYLVSLAAVLSLGFLLLISMLFTTGIFAVGQSLNLQIPTAMLQTSGSGVSFGLITLLFAMMFKWLPDAPVRWRDVWLGAAITAALFEIGKLLIGLYIATQALESTYGAATSLVVLLIWIYYSSQIVLLGAEFTHCYAQRQKSPQASA